MPSFDEFLKQKMSNYLGVSSYEDVPKEFQILIEGKDALSQEEQMLLQSGPRVQDHEEAGMMSYDDFYFFYFT